MSVRTGKGDSGFTDLLFRGRISKDSDEIRALGDIDELSSYLGIVKHKTTVRKEKAILEQIQVSLLIIASEIAIAPDKKHKLGALLKKEDAEKITKIAYQLEKKAKIDNCFYLPGEGELSSLLDISRSVARRAERSVVRLLKGDKSANKNILSYLNCVSDILYILARSKAGKKRNK